ncbi:putative aldouronate transport system substrate-binding protein [Paenibacillus anaericanus]|uniref:Extracellular solute-binding protein n=1 Tax=Paenibacillus anaericanus TaxID=170367 RepID=A0A3S1DSC6_9BACL|nr:extracellular solute-binding protein [Paenibacillus anaericanus]MDQ0086949.1 putative aldouronate transport system substrate-binding protein [Paenibacillus anaericanus]RUT46189.1 extracellular solute-binding protein [Paenibacillus anaericanus]
MKKRFVSMALVLTLLSSLLVACGANESKGSEDNKGKEAGSASENYDPNSKLDVTWLNILHTASPPTDTMVKKIEEYTNSKITFNWVPDASKEERITTALASGDLADIVTLTMLTNSSVRNSLKSGMFWEVSDYLDDYENLKLIPQAAREAASIEGKLYGVPFLNNLARGGLIFRQDWLENLGIAEPTTLDEVYEIARAFTEDDPDGNGKDDTIGFGDRSDLRYGSFKTLSSYFGTPNGWAVDENGKFTPEFDTQEYMDTLNYSRKLYENGYLAQDFAVTAKSDQEQQFAQGKAGIFTGIIGITGLRTLAEGLNMDFKLLPVNKISNGDGEYHIWSEGSGVNGLMAFPKTVVKTEAQLKRILKFVNDICDEEVSMYMTRGIEGVHYEYDAEGVTHIINKDLYTAEVTPFSSSRPMPTLFPLKSENPEKELTTKLINENDAFAVFDPTVPLDSATNNEQGTELAKIITDATFKYIMGQSDEAEFKKAVETWKKSGGSAIITEYEEAYKLTKK